MPPALENDLRMVKATILYADKAKLCSAGYSTWMPTFFNRNKTIEQMIKQTYDLEEAIPRIVVDNVVVNDFLKFIRGVRKILQIKNPTDEELKTITFFQQTFSMECEYINTKFPTLNLEFANTELKTAVNSGLLEIHRFELNENENIGLSFLRGTFQESLRNISKEFLDEILESVNKNSTYPLFDNATGNLVNLAVNAGELKINQTRIAQAKQSKLAAEVLQRLPVFDDASMSEILDVRKELERHLIRFRSAIIKYSEKIRNESWNKEFLVEAEETIHREIEPAVLDIEDAVKSNPSLSALFTRKFADKSTSATIGASSISFFVSQLNLLPTLTATALSTAATFGTNAAVAFYDAYKENQKQENELEKNQLYFYYKAGNLLSNKS